MGDQLFHSWDFSATALKQLGIDPSDFFDKHSVSIDGFKNADQDVPLRIWHALLDETVREKRNPYLGLQACSEADFGDLGPLGFAMHNASNVGVALKTLIQYLSLVVDDTKAELIRIDDTEFQLTYNILNVERPIHRTNIDWNLSFVLRFIRYCLGESWSPVSVELMYSEPSDLSVYDEVVRAPLVFGKPINKIRLLATDLNRSIAGADQRLFNSMITALALLKEKSSTVNSSNEDLINSIKSLICRQIADGIPKIESIAEDLRISSRSLQRQLASEGCSFKVIVEETREELAKSYIRSTHYSMTEIALMLGYSEVSAFTRAFKRWTHESPLSYRKKLFVDGSLSKKSND